MQEARAKIELPGELSSRYQVQEILGQGGMGEVLRARDLEAGGEVAIKWILGEVSPQAVARFEREARTLAEVEHPHVLKVLDSGSSSKGPYLVTELLDGDPLDEAPLDRDQKLSCLRQLAEVLVFLHQRGIVHRDVKPANGIWTREGRLVLIDFGLVRREGTQTLTRTGATLGTLPYLAPELLRGERATPASDLFAWGATAFVLLEGRPPFETETLFGCLDGQDLPSPKFETDLPAPVRARIQACLAPRPEDRPVEAEDWELSADWTPRRGLSSPKVQLEAPASLESRSISPPTPPKVGKPARGKSPRKIPLRIQALLFLGCLALGARILPDLFPGSKSEPSRPSPWEGLLEGLRATLPPPSEAARSQAWKTPFAGALLELDRRLVSRDISAHSAVPSVLSDWIRIYEAELVRGPLGSPPSPRATSKSVEIVLSAFPALDNSRFFHPHSKAPLRTLHFWIPTACLPLLEPTSLGGEPSHWNAHFRERRAPAPLTSPRPDPIVSALAKVRSPILKVLARILPLPEAPEALRENLKRSRAAQLRWARGALTSRDFAVFALAYPWDPKDFEKPPRIPFLETATSYLEKLTQRPQYDLLEKIQAHALSFLLVRRFLHATRGVSPTSAANEIPDALTLERNAAQGHLEGYPRQIRRFEAKTRNRPDALGDDLLALLALEAATDS